MFDMISSVIDNLFSTPVTRLFPKVIRKNFKNVRGKVGGVRIEECIFCGICERKCPSNCLKVDKVAKSWTIDRYKCIICSVCAEVCPKKCIDMDETFLFSSYEKTKDAYVSQNIEDKQADNTEK
jgi:formate hydrogenlyase subunit 6/NADH:ubiquinone oxidoreductase subunit I